MSETETLLVQQLQSESQKNAAFKTLITLYKERLYWHIRHIVKSHDDADDVLQNTFINLKAIVSYILGYIELQQMKL